jgi:hypothetical protein
VSSSLSSSYVSPPPAAGEASASASTDRTSLGVSGPKFTSRGHRRSITLALPFGDTPLDSEPGREFLQERVALFSRLTTLLGLFGLLAYELTLVGLPGYDFIELHRKSGTAFQIAAILLPALIWSMATRFRFSLKGLLALDAGGILLTLTAYAAMTQMGAAAYPQRVDLVIMLITICMVCLRAVIIPSAAGPTLFVGLLGSIPGLALAYVNAPTLMVFGASAPGKVAVGLAAIWSVVGIVISCVTSQVIYGLRCKVAQAERLGQYSLEEKIGEGGMGVVYKARHALLRRPTAIKLVLPERAGPEILARFEREVQLTASLAHPNTVSVYDYGRTPAGVFYYAMEYLDGIDLEKLVERFGPQPPARVVHVLTQVAGSLGEAHSVGLVHRDVKPANVILCEKRGLPDTAKVVDFGLVKDLTQLGRAQLTLSGTSSIVGTPLYLAPEAITNPEAIDARADLYALGAVGYYLLTGQPVFSGASLLEVAAQHLHQAPIPPSARSPHLVPAALENLVLACLAKDPGARPKNALEVVRALTSCRVAEWSTEQASDWWREHGAAARVRAGRSAEGPKTVLVDLSGRGERA